MNRERGAKMLQDQNSLDTIMDYIDQKVEIMGIPESFSEALQQF